MIELTRDQRQELTLPEPTALDPETKETYVLVRSKIYERLKHLLDGDVKVTGEMVDRLMAEEDEGDPTLAFYQQKYAK